MSHVENVKALVRQMKTAIKNENKEELSSAAHSLKFSSAMFDSIGLSGLAHALELMANDSTSWPDVRSIVAEITEEAQRSEQRLHGKILEIKATK